MNIQFIPMQSDVFIKPVNVLDLVVTAYCRLLTFIDKVMRCVI